MQTLFILEYQANNDGTCSMTPPLGYTDEAACLTAFYNKCAAAVSSNCDQHTVMITNMAGDVWMEHKQVISHTQSQVIS